MRDAWEPFSDGDGVRHLPGGCLRSLANDGAAHAKAHLSVVGFRIGGLGRRREALIGMLLNDFLGQRFNDWRYVLLWRLKPLHPPSIT